MLSPRAESPEGGVTGVDLRFRDSIYYPLFYLSISLCATALVVIAVLFVHPVSRPALDRVSFRLLVYALCGTLAFVITVPLSKGCLAVGSVFIFGSHFSSFLFFCIGLNLQLVMIHGIDGQKAEKYYVCGSLLVAVALAISTYASKQWTYSPQLRTCWVHSSDPAKQMLWQIANQHFWNFLSMVGDLVTFCAVLWYMIRLKVFDSGPGGRQEDDHPELTASRHYSKPIGPKKYRTIVLRISLYPLLSLTTLGIISIGNIYLASKGLKTRADWKVLFTRTIHLSRGTLYTIVASMDPAISRAFKALYRHYRPRVEPRHRNDDSLRTSIAFEDMRNFESHSESGGTLSRAADNSCDPKVEETAETQNNLTVPTIPTPAAMHPDSHVRRDSRYQHPLGRNHIPTIEDAEHAAGWREHPEQWLDLERLL
ncbi:hypothetical protein V5O48_013532 [Marasmius crinis-equi]|uniref:Uncharacterized protein n=1 Tax=Marasmius crinis-equi TaxID=585013 RepID=A0ABR3EZT5_9AGAR